MQWSYHKLLYTTSLKKWKSVKAELSGIDSSEFCRMLYRLTDQIEGYASIQRNSIQPWKTEGLGGVGRRMADSSLDCGCTFLKLTFDDRVTTFDSHQYKPPLGRFLRKNRLRKIILMPRQWLTLSHDIRSFFDCFRSWELFTSSWYEPF